MGNRYNIFMDDKMNGRMTFKRIRYPHQSFWSREMASLPEHFYPITQIYAYRRCDLIYCIQHQNYAQVSGVSLWVGNTLHILCPDDNETPRGASSNPHVFFWRAWQCADKVTTSGMVMERYCAIHSYSHIWQWMKPKGLVQTSRYANKENGKGPGLCG